MSLFLGATTIDAVYAGIPGTIFAPVSVFINTVGAWTYPVPAGANRIDVVAFGAGGGGAYGSTATEGRGGGAGGSSSRTFIIGSDHPATNVVGNNGKGGAANGGNGQATSVTSGSVAVTGSGGTFASQPASVYQGADAADVFLNGNTYAGGKGGRTHASDGGQPGGGGAGGASGARSAGDGGAGGTYLRFYDSAAGSPGMAQAVYLGSEKVWPIFVPQLSSWYSPSPGQDVRVTWPTGAEFCDVIMVGGGAGGTGTGISGNAQKGGGDGQWNGATIPRTEGSLTYTSLSIVCNAVAGADGVGGGNFSTEAADGSTIRVFPQVPANGGGYSTGAIRNSGQGLDKTSNTGNRNGGNVATEFVYNGRTYTMASYGTNAGRGGATSNKNGGDGTRPGGGGQSADNGGLTGYNGGKGAHGAAILYWY